MIVFSTIRQFVRAHPGKTLLVVIAAVLYIAFNVWFYFFTTSGGLKTNPVVTITETIKRFGNFRLTAPSSPPEGQSPTSSFPQRPAPTPTPPAKQDPAPRDTPRPTGPGDFACDPYGQCNLYSDEVRKQYCTVTFADSLCLDQCGEKTKQCTK